MTIQKIILSLDRLKQLHTSMLSVSKEKTEAIKDNKIEQLHECLVAERKHLSAIEKLEKKRMEEVKTWALQENQTEEHPTISHILTVTEGEENRRLLEVYKSFLIVLADLKQQECLNGELTRQSLQFVNMSLDLLEPSIKNLNYGESAADRPKRSIFDSKA
ncbi:flagellar protein FlgN [Halobacillus massiliensis]|uniref:flagellar protein FlgN n=1 Tax=Halobacillus massiliensis TaxID=1926286 RepID=UPI0009E612AC|nr:flagellar protein FlgN [Halobacillus massiliensis]